MSAALVWRAVGEKTLRTRAHWFRWYSLASAAAAVTLPWWLMRFGVNPANVGLFQRASFAVLNVWLLVFAVVVWSRLTPAYEAMQTRELSHRTDC